MAKVYALVDCNSFFCSCERLFRPDLKNTPVGVLSNNDGCFVSRTPELKDLKVPMGAPYFQYKEVCEKNNVAVFSSNYALYTNISDRVMIALSQFTPVLEVYSVDEAFLDLSGFKNLDEYAELIKKQIYKQVGVPVSIGLGPTKTLAKVANFHAKKNKSGVVSLLDEKVQTEYLQRTPIREVWGVGRASVSKFESLRIKTAKDFRDFKNTVLIKKIFTKVGLQRKEELQGESRFFLNALPEKKKNITASRSFGESVKSIKELREAVATHVSKVCERLRAQDSVCNAISINIRTSPFSNERYYRGSGGKEMLSPTSDTKKVIKYALSALDELFKDGYNYKKAGVGLSGIHEKNESQLSLLDENPDDEKSEQLMQTLDHINQMYGPQTVKFAVCGVEKGKKNWAMRSKLKSPRYVTGWSELPKVK